MVNQVCTDFMVVKQDINLSDHHSGYLCCTVLCVLHRDRISALACLYLFCYGGMFGQCSEGGFCLCSLLKFVSPRGMNEIALSCGRYRS